LPEMVRAGGDPPAPSHRTIRDYWPEVSTSVSGADLP
jgi:hypothetical protein